MNQSAEIPKIETTDDGLNFRHFDRGMVYMRQLTLVQLVVSYQ
jgi:hypothetical protein